MNKNFVPLLDAARHIEDAVTKTADYNGAAHSLGAGFAPNGPGMCLAAVIAVTALDHTTGDETYNFHVEESADGSTWTVAGPVVPITETGTFSIPGFFNTENMRLVLDVAGTTPSITYSTEFGVLDCD